MTRRKVVSNWPVLICLIAVLLCGLTFGPMGAAWSAAGILIGGAQVWALWQIVRLVGSVAAGHPNLKRKALWCCFGLVVKASALAAAVLLLRAVEEPMQSCFLGSFVLVYFASLGSAIREE